MMSEAAGGNDSIGSEQAFRKIWRPRMLADKTQRFIIGQNELVIEPTTPCLQSGKPNLLNLAGADATR